MIPIILSGCDYLSAFLWKNVSLTFLLGLVFVLHSHGLKFSATMTDFRQLESREAMNAISAVIDHLEN